MKKSKRNMVISLMLAGVILLSACAPAVNSRKSSDDLSDDLTYTDTHVTGTLCEGVSVDADFPDLSQVSSYPIISGQMKKTDEEVIQKIKDYIFRDYKPEEIQKETASDSWLVNYYIPGTGEDWKKSLGVYGAPDETGFIAWDYEAYPYYFVTYNRGILPTEGVEIYPFINSGIENLSFMGREEAVKEVKDKLAQWNIPITGEPLVYTLDGETMYQLLENWNQSGYAVTDLEGVTTEMLDCYYMIFDTGYQGIPYTFFMRTVEGKYYNGARLECHLTKQGIVEMEYHWAEYDVEEVESHESALSIEEALAGLQRHFEQTVLTSEIDILKIYFQYVPVKAGESDGSYVFAPAWVFQPAGEVAGEYGYLDPVFIHAITGEEI